jgi:hypothetical protein
MTIRSLVAHIVSIPFTRLYHHDATSLNPRLDNSHLSLALYLYIKYGKSHLCSWQVDSLVLVVTGVQVDAKSIEQSGSQ